MLLSFMVRFYLQEKYIWAGNGKRHGEDYDWRNEPIDGAAVYASGGGNNHGERCHIFLNFVNMCYKLKF
jgi:hypothetical protein